MSMRVAIEVVIVDGGDWHGLYIDGELVEEGHSLCVSDVLRKVRDTRRPIASVETIEADQTWLEDHGFLPKHLSNVVKFK